MPYQAMNHPLGQPQNDGFARGFFARDAQTVFGVNVFGRDPMEVRHAVNLSYLLHPTPSPNRVLASTKA